MNMKQHYALKSLLNEIDSDIKAILRNPIQSRKANMLVLRDKQRAIEVIRPLLVDTQPIELSHDERLELAFEGLKAFHKDALRIAINAKEELFQARLAGSNNTHILQKQLDQNNELVVCQRVLLAHCMSTETGSYSLSIEPNREIHKSDLVSKSMGVLVELLGFTVPLSLRSKFA